MIQGLFVDLVGFTSRRKTCSMFLYMLNSWVINCMQNKTGQVSRQLGCCTINKMFSWPFLHSKQTEIITSLCKTAQLLGSVSILEVDVRSKQEGRNSETQMWHLMTSLRKPAQQSSLISSGAQWFFFFCITVFLLSKTNSANWRRHVTFLSNWTWCRWWFWREKGVRGGGVIY